MPHSFPKAIANPCSMSLLRGHYCFGITAYMRQLKTLVKSMKSSEISAADLHSSPISHRRPYLPAVEVEGRSHSDAAAQSARA